MNIKLSEVNNLQTVKADKTAVVKSAPVAEPQKVELNKYSSKVDLSKLIKDPKLSDKVIQFEPEQITASAVEPEFNMDQKMTEHIELSKKVVEDESTLSVVGSVLSAVKLPQAEPIKLTVNILTADKKKENLAKDLECKNYEGIANNTVDFAKSGWGSAVSLAKVAEWGTEAVVDFGILSRGGRAVSKINKVTTGVSTVATKVAIPFSVVGTGLNAWDVKSANDKVKQKSNQIKALETLSAAGASVTARPGQKAKLEAELKNLKTSRTYKSIAFGLSAVSTATLIASVKNPAKATSYGSISLVTSIASSVTSALADEKLRAKASKALGKLYQKF